MFQSRKFLCLIFALLFSNREFNLLSQINIRSSAQAGVLISPSVGFHLPQNDLNKRFGPFNSIGLSLSEKERNGLIFGLSAFFLFNEKVKERDMLKGITTNDGFLIGGDGTLYDLYYYMRGLHLMANLSFIIPKTGHNANSGLIASFSPGYLMHRIRFEPEDRNAPLPQLTKTGMRNYDRLSGGISLNPSLGYFFLGNRGLVNFYVQLEYSLAFTKNLRDYQYDQPGPFREKRKDDYIGMRFGWILPIYRKAADEYFSY